MDVDDWNSPTTKLLTLLNVSAAKSSKRKFSDLQSSATPKQKLNKRRVEILVPGTDDMETTEPEVEPEQGDSAGDVGVGEAADVSDAEGV
jgi:U3 small nucleolar RNA-associated protein 25